MMFATLTYCFVAVPMTVSSADVSVQGVRRAATVSGQGIVDDLDLVRRVPKSLVSVSGQGRLDDTDLFVRRHRGRTETAAETLNKLIQADTKEGGEVGHDKVQFLPSLSGKTLTAFCVAGDMRTFPEVGRSLAAFLRKSPAAGMRQTDGADVFLSLGLQDDPHYDSLYNKSRHSEAEIQNVVKLLDPRIMHFMKGTGEATAKNVESSSYIAQESRDCFNEKGWTQAKKFNAFWQNRTNMARSMNQLGRVMDCLRSIKANEETNGRKYSVVAIARPDLQYGPIPENIFAEVAATGETVWRYVDWIFMFKRELMDNFFTRTGPIACHSGQTCCGKVADSESLFSFILGCDDPCKCANEEAPRARKNLNVCLRRSAKDGYCQASLRSTVTPTWAEEEMIRLRAVSAGEELIRFRPASAVPREHGTYPQVEPSGHAVIPLESHVNPPDGIGVRRVSASPQHNPVQLG